MKISDLEVSTIEEVKEFQAGTSVKIKGSVTTALKPRKLWKGISQFIVIKDNTDSIGCNVSCESINEGYELGENLFVVGDRGEYPEKDRRTGQLTGNQVKNINGYVEEKWVDLNEDLKEEAKVEDETELDKKMTKEFVDNNKVTQPKYRQEDYWRDKFLLDVERQEIYKGNNDTIIRECAIKAVTSMYAIPDEYHEKPFITNEQSYFEFADRIVNWIKNDEDFKLQTEANLIISGLSPLKKAEIVDWINEVRIGTDIEDDDQFLIKLNVQVLPAQTVKELRETVDTMMKYFREPKEE